MGDRRQSRQTLTRGGAAIFVAAPIAGSRITRVGERRFVVGGLLLAAAGMGWIALIAKPNLAYWHMVAPPVLSGLGMSMTIPATQSAVLSHVAPQGIGKGSGTFTTLRQLGGAFGLASAVAVFASTGGYQSARAFSDGFGPALAVCAALALAGAFAGTFLPRPHAASAAPTLDAPDAAWRPQGEGSVSSPPPSLARVYLPSSRPTLSGDPRGGVCFLSDLLRGFAKP